MDFQELINQKPLHWIHHVHYFFWYQVKASLRKQNIIWAHCMHPTSEKTAASYHHVSACLNRLSIDIQSIDRNQPTLPQLCPLGHCFVSLLKPAAYFPCSLYPHIDSALIFLFFSCWATPAPVLSVDWKYMSDYLSKVKISPLFFTLSFIAIQ